MTYILYVESEAITSGRIKGEKSFEAYKIEEPLLRVKLKQKYTFQKNYTQDQIAKLIEEIKSKKTYPAKTSKFLFDRFSSIDRDAYDIKKYGEKIMLVEAPEQNSID